MTTYQSLRIQADDLKEQMTDNEIIVEVAKLDGWSGLRLTVKGAGGGGRKPTPHGRPPGRNYEHPCNDYLRSRDAIIPVIAKQSEQIQDLAIDFFLCDVGATNGYGVALRAILLATPRQLCAALLKATGKWRSQ